MQAVLKVLVRAPLEKQQAAYLCSGTRTRSQILEIITLLAPSIPGADFLFELFIALSSSSKEIG